MYFEVKSLKLYGPLCLSSVAKLSGLEVFEVSVICDNFDRFLIPFHVLPPFLQGCDNCKQFFFVDLVVAFCGSQLLRVECYWLQPSLIIWLGYGARNAVV